MAEEKYKFDPFKFINNRSSSIEPTEEDFNNFNNYMTLNVLSMHKEQLKNIESLNNRNFAKLTKKQQCLAYTSFNGKYFPFKPYLKSHKNQFKDDSMIKISKLLKLSVREILRRVRANSINVDEALLLYAEIYEPETLITKTGKVKKI